MNLDWNHLEVRIVSAGYSLWESGVLCSKTWIRRVIPDNDLWIFDTGKCSMQMVGGKTKLNRDSIIWMRPGHIYDVTQDPDDPIGHTYIHFDLIDSLGRHFFPTPEQMPETLHSFNIPQWRQMGQNIVRIMNLGNSIERNPQCFPHGCRNEDKFAVASAMLKALLQERVLDYVAMDIKNSPQRYAEACGGVDILSEVHFMPPCTSRRRPAIFWRSGNWQKNSA